MTFFFFFFFQFVGDARDCESYLRQLQDTIKRQYTCDKNSRLGRLEDLLQDSMVGLPSYSKNSNNMSAPSAFKTYFTYFCFYLFIGDIVIYA